MSEAAPFVTLNDEVLRQIGRNLVLYQKIEIAFKSFFKSSNFKVKVGEQFEEVQIRLNSMDKSMLSYLINRFCDEVLVNPDSGPDTFDDANIQFSYRIYSILDSDALEVFKFELRQLLEDRNYFVHHFLERWKLNDQQTMAAASAFLNQQYLKGNVVLEKLIGVLRQVDYARDMLNTCLSNPDAINPILSALNFADDDRIEQVAMSFCKQNSREDGWSSFAQLSSLIHYRYPEEVAALKAKYSGAFLRKYLEQTESFDFSKEKIDGSSHVLPLIKPR